MTRPEVVYHYTSLDALTKIIETKQLWATSIAYLNDTSERILFRDSAFRRLEVLLKEQPQRRMILDEGPKPNLPSFDFDQTLSAFVSSFSIEKDSLPQWRAYTPPGLGVNIGFRASCLLNARASFAGFHPSVSEQAIRKPSIRFDKVTYVDREQSGTEDEMLITFYEAVAKDFVRLQKAESYIGRFDLFLEKRLGALGCMYKHSSFSNESEYRLLVEGPYWPSVPLHFRSAHSTLIPYLKLDVPDTHGRFGYPSWDAIESIKIGPSPNIPLTQAAIAGLLMTRGTSVTMIDASLSPFRNL